MAVKKKPPIPKMTKSKPPQAPKPSQSAMAPRQKLGAPVGKMTSAYCK